MDTVQLTIAAEEFIINRNRVTPCTLAKELGCVTAELKVTLSTIVSNLILKHGWKTEHINSRLFIVAESFVDKSINATVTQHKNEDIKTIQPKCIPVDGDWVVRSSDSGFKRLYFDKMYTRDEVRHSYSKSQKADHSHVNACVYHKVVPIKAMHNFDTRLHKTG